MEQEGVMSVGSLGVEQIVQSQLTRTTVDVASLVRQYREKAPQTRECLDHWMIEEYGIDQYTSIVDDWWRQDTDAPVALCMARQIPTWSAEAVSLHLLADWVNGCGVPCRAFPISFTRDCYGKHGYKHSLTTLREIQHFRPGKYAVVGRRVLPKNVRKDITERKPIMSTLKVVGGDYWGVDVPEGMPLVDFHYNFRRHVLGEHEWAVQHDVQSLFLECLRQCVLSGREPGHVFVRVNGHDQQWSVSDDNRDEIASKDVRPSAYWYYRHYLSLFTTGERVLVASLDDDDDVHEMFSASLAIEEAVGVQPLIVWVPYKSQEMRSGAKPLLFNEVNPAVLRHGWRDNIEQPSSEMTVYRAMESFEHQVLKLV